MEPLKIDLRQFNIIYNSLIDACSRQVSDLLESIDDTTDGELTWTTEHCDHTDRRAKRISMMEAMLFSSGVYGQITTRKKGKDTIWKLRFSRFNPLELEERERFIKAINQENI